MPDLRRTRKNLKTALAIMAGVDLLAAAIYFSPLVGSAETRRQELNKLQTELDYQDAPGRAAERSAAEGRAGQSSDQRFLQEALPFPANRRFRPNWANSARPMECPSSRKNIR